MRLEISSVATKCTSKTRFTIGALTFFDKRTCLVRTEIVGSVPADEGVDVDRVSLLMSALKIWNRT